MLKRIGQKPVYQDDHVALYHADCRDILSQMETDENSIIISDPPYGIRWHHSRSRVVRRIIGDDEPFNPSHLLPWRCVLFGAQHYYQNLPGGSSWQIWDKRCPAAEQPRPHECKCGPCRTNQQSDFEDIWCSFHCHRTIYRHMWNGFCKASEQGQARIHPTQKPIMLMLYLIQAHTQPGDLVIDPYAGGCATLLAARAAGRCAIGIELDRAYIKPAIRRLKELAR